MKKTLQQIFSGAALGLLLLCGTQASAQIAYTQGFEDDNHGWETELLEYDDLFSCDGTGALSANLWYFSFFGAGDVYAEMVSPSVGVSNGGAVTVSYSYKLIDYDEVTPTEAGFGTIKAYYATSATGPWILFDTVDASNHVASDDCALRTATIGVGEGSQLYIKIAVEHSFDDAYDYYAVIDDVEISQAAPVGCSTAPAVTNLSATKYMVCNTDNAVVITLTEQYIGTGYTYQWQTSADNITYTDIPGATGTTFSVAPTATVWYRVIVTCSNGNLSTTSTSVRIVSTGNNCYCAVAFSDATEPITRVNFAGIDNVTSANAVGLPAYEDFSFIQANVVAGQSYPIIVEGNTVYDTDTNEYNVYFDWNQNGTFDDAGEGFYIGSITGSTGTDGQFATTDIPVPAGALSGPTKMRVVKKYDEQALACNTVGYGQAEDYIVNVQATASAPSFDASAFVYYPNPVKDVLNLKHINGIQTVAVYNLMGQQVLAKTINGNEASVDMTQLSAGAYLVKVTAAGAVKTIKVAKQ